jgi:hypothetical protein
MSTVKYLFGIVVIEVSVYLIGGVGIFTLGSVAESVNKDVATRLLPRMVALHEEFVKTGGSLYVGRIVMVNDRLFVSVPLSVTVITKYIEIQQAITLPSCLVRTHQ